MSISTYCNNSIRTRYSLDVIVKILKTEDAYKTRIIDNNNNNDIDNNNSNNNTINEGVNFLICNACSWCASIYSSAYSNTNNISIARCPLCYDSGLELIPISKDESFRISYTPKAGIVLEFLRYE